MLAKKRVLCTIGIVLLGIGMLFCLVLTPWCLLETYLDWKSNAGGLQDLYPNYFDWFGALLGDLAFIFIGGLGAGFCGILLTMVGRGKRIAHKRVLACSVFILGITYVAVMIICSIQQTYAFWIENRDGINMPISDFWECYFDRNGACHLFAACALLGTVFTGWQVLQTSDQP